MTYWSLVWTQQALLFLWRVIHFQKWFSPQDWTEPFLSHFYVKGIIKFHILKNYRNQGWCEKHFSKYIAKELCLDIGCPKKLSFGQLNYECRASYVIHTCITHNLFWKHIHVPVNTGNSVMLKKMLIDIQHVQKR